ncbi:FecR family protein [Mariniphaga anaerophila]|uniref:FecR family protein n=1 Tax=Mariniphaga anaerophila TaxID=1484053 RepID=A0A1M4YZY0_9BACT|nr:FecR family protein [Mariniphaga anaerophila]SHF11127.1 FecR family protein [Mariniphaga anaerophila]
MDKKYTKYTVEDLTQDRAFILWVRKKKNHLAWINFLQENPDKKKEIETARKIIELLKSKQADISEEEMYAVWNNIELFHTLHQRKRKLQIQKILRYAAILILTLAIGAIIPYFYFKQDYKRYSKITVSQPNQGEARLILADGAEVRLKDKESKLQFDKSGEKIKLNNDSIIEQSTAKQKNQTTMNQVVVPFGQRASLELSDGTKVWLNAGSKLIFPPIFDSNNRSVFLEGEAFFNVTKNKEKPFIVATNEVSVTVLGTEFNISAYSSDEELETVLVEGSIIIEEQQYFKLRTNKIVLTPGQKAIYNRKNSNTTVVNNVDLDYYTFWKDGLLHCKSESILNIFKRLSRYYNVEFITERSIDINDQMAGKLDLKDSLPDVLDVIQDVAPVTYTIDGNRVYIYDKFNYLRMRK